MPSFITQTIDQRPVVLVFSSASSLVNPLTEQLQKLELDVIFQPITALYAQGTDLVKQLHPHRVIVLTTHLEELKQTQLKLLGIPIYIVSGISADNELSENDRKDQLKLISHLREEPGIKLILGTELLIDNPEPVFSWQKLLVQQKNEPIAPKVLPLTDPHQFSYHVAAHLFQLHAPKFHVFTSKTQVFPLQAQSTEVASQVHFDDAKISELPAAAPAIVFQATQQFLATHPVIEVPTKPQEVVLAATAQPESQRSIAKIVAPKPGQKILGSQAPHKLTKPRAELPKAKVELDTYSGVIRTTPVYIPRVPNRLKVYEQRKTDLQRQHELKNKFIVPTKGKLFKVGAKKSLASSDLSEAQLEQVVQSVFKVQRQQTVDHRHEFKIEKVVAVKKKSQRRKSVTIFAGVCLGILLFGVAILSLYSASSWWMKLRLNDLVQNYLTLSTSERHYRASELNQVSQFVAIQTEAYELVLGKSQLADTRRQAEIAHSFSTAVQQEKSLQAEALNVTNTFLGKQKGDFFAQYLSLSQVLQQQYQQLSLVTSQLQTLRDEQEAEQLPESLLAIEGQVQDMRRAAVSVQQLDSFIPALFAQHGRRVYAVVIENSQELRSSGGLIESVVLLTIDNGQLLSSSVYDVNRLDNQLSGTLAAPAELKEYLDQQRLLLRDSSWFADAPTAATQVRRQLASSTNTQIDGVIFLTTPAVQKLVETVGPITVESYDEEVTDKNVLSKLEFHSELQLTDQAKEPYATALTRALVKKIISSPELSLKSLQTFYGQLRQADALFVPALASEASVMNGLGWSGTVTTPDCPSPLSGKVCQVDTVYQVESNIGVNKANASVSRQIDEQITLTSDQIIHQRTILLNNDGRSNAWPSGTYKTYLRFFLPSTAVGATLSMNADSVPLKVDRSETAALSQQALGAVVELPIQQSATLVLSYSLPRLTGEEYSYTFFDQKQPGIPEDDWSVKIINETTLRPTQIAPEGKISGNTILFQAKRDRHQFVGVKFTR